MAVGLPAKTTYVDGDVFSASDINDTNGTLNLVGQTTNFYAGKNKIINGDFGIWQRGTSFTPTDGSFVADRWRGYFNGTGSTRTYSQQSFTPGTAPVAGYEGTFFVRLAQTVAGTLGTYNQFNSQIENVRTFAGQTATVSFWAKASSTTVLPFVLFGQNFGTSGSSDVDTNAVTSLSISTSWTRYSYSVAIPSVAGKTINANNHLSLKFGLPLNSTFTLDFWGVQVEAGSVATAFQTATGNPATELAACQRYYQRLDSTENNYTPFMFGAGTGSTNIRFFANLPVSMRTSGNVTVSAFGTWGTGNNNATITAVSGSFVRNKNTLIVDMTTNSATISRSAYSLESNNTASAIIQIESEM
jgi:hypothetical protein